MSVDFEEELWGSCFNVHAWMGEGSGISNPFILEEKFPRRAGYGRKVGTECMQDG